MRNRQAARIVKFQFISPPDALASILSPVIVTGTFWKNKPKRATRPIRQNKANVAALWMDRRGKQFESPSIKISISPLFNNLPRRSSSRTPPVANFITGRQFAGRRPSQPIEVRAVIENFIRRSTRTTRIASRLGGLKCEPLHGKLLGGKLKGFKCGTPDQT